MKREEELVKQYLLKQGYGEIVFEPKGKRPPDLLINNTIAVEVRRLNQFQKAKPIEQLQHKLIPRLLNLFKKYGDGNHNNSAWVSIYYSRPLKVDKKLIHKVEEVLDLHNKSIFSTEKYQINDRLRLEIAPSKKRFDRLFVYRSSIDEDHGGFVVHNIYESLKLIVPEKSDKIKPYRDEFKIWWLALVDNIGFGMDAYDINQLKQVIDFNVPFDKLIFVSPISPEEGSELCFTGS